MKRKTRRTLAAYAIAAVVCLGLVLLTGAVGYRTHGQYDTVLPLVGLLVLFVIGQLIITPGRRRS